MHAEFFSKSDPPVRKVRELAAELRRLTTKLLTEAYDSQEEFREDLKILNDKATELDEVIK